MEFKLKIIGVLYRHILKHILFLIDAERIHEAFIKFGEILGRFMWSRRLVKKFFYVKPPPILSQNIAGIDFKNPVGLAAGFDYDVRLTQILPDINFGWATVGTITNSPYGGNPRPRLARLPRSKSLLVNKGFKNPGAVNVAAKLQNLHFEIPIGISIGRTNSPDLSQKQSVEDIISAFKIFENSNAQFAYYELNISCPNLYGNVTFYTSHNLAELLNVVEKLELKKPIFIKMPTSQTDEAVLKMLDVIVRYKIDGVIFGNLQKDRTNPLLDKHEISKAGEGSFSGLPAKQRSNELIKLAYHHCGKKLTIVGCGGIFNAKDVYEKIRLGASLVQLITGMIYEGPQLISEINLGLVDLLKKDGFKNITEAVGADFV